MDTGDSRQAGFNADEVRSGLRFAMQMGLPGTVSERVTFFWNSDKTYTNSDVTGNPYDWTETPASTDSRPDEPGSLTLPVAVEFASRGTDSSGTRVGDFDNPRVKLTLLDEEYASIDDDTLGLPNGVVVDGSTYDIEFWAPPVGLFDLTVHEAFCKARDEA